MKIAFKNHQPIFWALTVSLISLLFLFSSCEESSFAVPTVSEKDYTVKDYGVYPMAQSITRSSNNGFWEAWDFIALKNGNQVETPWNNVSTTSAVPHDILQDIKYEDGWDLIFYRIEEGEGSVRNSPHLVFHNRYTGILKVFSYLSQEAFFPNNHGIWQIDTTERTSIFAFQNEIISKISEPQDNTYYVSNITKNSTHGFSIGWNCFQIELAYDPAQSGWMSISTLASNEIEISLSGNIEAETKGLMTTSKGNSYGNGVAKIAGEQASTWIDKKLKDKTIPKIALSILKDGVKAVVSGGVGKAIGALTGLFKKDETTTSFQLTTNGSFTVKGTAKFESTAPIPTLQFNIAPSQVGYLGVWGLKEEPTLLFTPYAILKSPQEYTNGYTREYRVDIVNYNTARASIVFNPTLDQYITKKSHSTDFFESGDYTKRDIWGRIGALGRIPNNYNDVVYENIRKPNYYMIADVAFMGEEDYLPIDQFEAPMEVFIPNVPNGPKGARPEFRYDSKFIATVGVSLTLPNGSEALSYRRCLPNIDWNYSDFNNGLYWFFYPCEPVTPTKNGYSIRSTNGLDREILKMEHQLNKTE